MMANDAGMAESVTQDQIKYLGAIYAENSFRDGRQYMRDTMKMSSNSVQRRIDRATYFAHRSGADPQQQTSQPTFPKLVDSMTRDQKLGTILNGMFYTIRSMAPAEIGITKAH